MKKLIAMFLLVLGIVGCGNSKTTTTTTKASTATTVNSTTNKTTTNKTQSSTSSSKTTTNKMQTTTTTTKATTTTKKPTTIKQDTTTGNVTTTKPSEVNFVTECSGLNESISAVWNDTNGANSSVYYKLSSESTYTKADSELIRFNDTKAAVDIVGIKKGTYDVKIISGSNQTQIITNIAVQSQDRSGYAHFNNSTGVGAYNNDGTLKANAIVVYVNNDNKNTVTATLGSKTYTGLVNILQNASKSSYPIVIRILGTIKTNQWNSKSDEPRLADNSNYTSSQDTAFFTNTFDTSQGENLVGLTVKLMDKKAGKAYNYITTATGLSKQSDSSSSAKTTTYKGNDYPNAKGTVYDDDSYTNMLDVSNAKNVTVEGIGADAVFYQFGFTWSSCNSIEVKNIKFTDYPEDACSFQGGSNSDVNNVGNYWIHNNVFNRGKNNWDVSGERDKPYGDGAMDLKFCHGVTAAYNEFNSCKKTGLVGGSDSNLTKDITFHHNFYNQVGSRLPLGRQANMHMYNNYYKDISGSCLSLRAGAYAFVEACYFENSKNPFTCKTSSSYANGEAKLYQNVLTGCSYDSSDLKIGVEVSSREETVANSCTYGTTFDTDSSKFYYDSTNKVSDVEYLTSAEQAKIDVPILSGTKGSTLEGAISGGNTGSGSGDSGNTGSDVVDENATVLDLSSLSGNLSGTQTVGIYTLIPGTKTISISNNEVTVNGITSTKALKFSGVGTTENCCISFTISEEKTVTIIATSGNSTENRTLNISNGTSVVKTATAGTSATITTFTLSAGTYYIYSAGSGIYVNYLAVS